jgi:hypothetical protein
MNKLILIAMAAMLSCSAIAKEKVSPIILTPTPTGSEGSKKFTDESEFIIDAKSNTVICNNGTETDDWTVEAFKLPFKEAKGKTFSLLFGAAKSFVMASGASYGAIETPAGIDRAAGGALGVLGGLGNGIDTNEGYQFGLNLSNLPDNVTVQITKINIGMINPNETGVVVNRMNPEKSLTFSVKGTPGIQAVLPNNGDWLDISSLGIKLNGGQKIADMMSFICTVGTNTSPNNAATNYRIKGIELSINK